MQLDPHEIKRDFPIFKTYMSGKPLVYLDSASTSQKPMQVISSIDDYYKNYNANIHRGVYQIAEKATEKYIESKQKVAKFINANSIEEIVYVRNTTEAINLIALSWARQNIKKADHILISEMEHHSNIVPWQMLAKEKKAVLDYIKMDGTKKRLDEQSITKQLEKAPKLVSITHVSNVLGTINDVKSITAKAHRAGAKVLIDAAQSVPHMKVDLKSIDCDFMAFSAHKMLGPLGVGVLYAKKELLDSTEPLFGGGDMIKSVSFSDHSWNELPWKFEAGTSNISGGIALGSAIDYINAIGIDRINDHETSLTRYALQKLEENNVKYYGLGNKEIKSRAGVISFKIDGVHPHDVAQIFDSEGIAIRAGHHCAMPLVTQVLGEPALSRMSFYLYNTKEEVDKAINAIQKVRKLFKKR